VKSHDFTIDTLTRPRDGKTVYVARCVHSGCTWHTGELTSRRKAVVAAWVHQANMEIGKL
jgi:hypothetical protein